MWKKSTSSGGGRSSNNNNKKAKFTHSVRNIKRRHEEELCVLFALGVYTYIWLYSTSATYRLRSFGCMLFARLLACSLVVCCIDDICTDLLLHIYVEFYFTMIAFAVWPASGLVVCSQFSMWYTFLKFIFFIIIIIIVFGANTAHSQFYIYFE